MGEPWANRIVGYGEEAPDQLLANPRNFRIHPKPQQDALLGVLREVGVVQDVLVNKSTGFVVDGHLRISLALREKQTTIPVKYVELSEDEEALILATLDPLTALAATDKEKLDALLRDVSTGDAAVQQMLADMAEREGIVSLPTPGGGGDDFDTTPDEGPTRVQTGDVWAIRGNGLEHRLICGDCTDAAVVERLMGGDDERPLLMVTDPPYGVEYEPTWRHARGLNQSPRVGAVANDGVADWRAAWDLFPGDIAYVWHADLRARQVVEGLEASRFEVRAQIIWAKQQIVIGRGHYHFQHEPCWYAVRKGATANWASDRKQSTLWQIDNPLKSGEVATAHGTQKPLECMARPIRNHDAPSVYDPFLGSGTTMVAGHRLGRKVYGCEIEPKYVDVCLRRAEAEGLICEKLAEVVV